MYMQIYKCMCIYVYVCIYVYMYTCFLQVHTHIYLLMTHGYGFGLGRCYRASFMPDMACDVDYIVSCLATLQIFLVLPRAESESQALTSQCYQRGSLQQVGHTSLLPVLCCVQKSTGFHQVPYGHFQVCTEASWPQKL